MLNQDDKFERFAQVINKNARAQCKKIEKQSETFKKQQLKQIESQAKQELDSRFNFEAGRIGSEINAAISQLKNESKRQAAEKREDISRLVFQQAEKKLADFCKTPDYEELLRKSLASVSESIDGSLTIYAKQSEIGLVERLCGDMPAVKQVKANSKIKIGGLCASNEDETVYIDDTLDQRLKAQKEWFMSRTELRITD